MNDLYDLLQTADPDTIKAMLESGLVDDRLGIANKQMGMGESLYGMPSTAQGTNLGYTYIAASPLSHLANAIRQYKGMKMMQQGQHQMQALPGQRESGREAYLRLLAGQGQPQIQQIPSSGTGGEF